MVAELLRAPAAKKMSIQPRLNSGMETPSTVAPVLRARVEAMFKHYAARDFKAFADFLDDDVEWTISGPVDILPFCGTRRGKAKVFELVSKQIPDVLRVFNFAQEAMLIDGDNVATLIPRAGKAQRRRPADQLPYCYLHALPQRPVRVQPVAARQFRCRRTGARASAGGRRRHGQHRDRPGRHLVFPARLRH